MPPLAPVTIVVLVITSGFFFSFIFWLGAYFYRQSQSTHFFDESQVYPNHQSRFMTVDGVKLHFTVEGDGPDIILIHGIAANIYTWRKLAPLLAARGHRVWAIDMKGFGLSDKPRRADYRLEAQADLLARFMKLNNLGQSLIVGNSMGGAIAIELGLRHPDVARGLILMNSVHDPKTFKIDIKVFSRFVRLLVPMVGLLSPLVNRESVRPFLRHLYGPNYRVTDDDLKGYLAPYMQGTSGNTAFMWALKGLMENSQTSRVQELRLPVLILWGAHDKLIPVALGEQLHERVLGSRLEIHPDAGHHVQEEDPTWVTEQILGFENQILLAPRK